MGSEEIVRFVNARLLDLGARYSLSIWRGGTAAAVGEVKATPEVRAPPWRFPLPAFAGTGFAGMTKVGASTRSPPGARSP